jgi:hypothetical protein
VSHPSRLQLDAYALGAKDDATAAHAETCPDCSAHLQAVRVQLPVPSWVPGATQPPRPRWRWAAAVAALATVAVIGFLVPKGATDEVTAKGAPTVQVWVNHSGRAAIWDGAAPLHPGDMVRFDVASAGYRQLTVVELQDGQLYQVLHSAPVAPHETSPAWRVDDEGTREEIGVLLSNGPLSEAELRASLKGHGAVWSKQWVFQKEP